MAAITIYQTKEELDHVRDAAKQELMKIYTRLKNPPVSQLNSVTGYPNLPAERGDSRSEYTADKKDNVSIMDLDDEYNYSFPFQSEALSSFEYSKGKLFYSINYYLICRQARDFRDTPKFRNTMLEWVQASHQDTPRLSVGDYNLNYKVWVQGVLHYFEGRVHSCIVGSDPAYYSSVARGLYAPLDGKYHHALTPERTPQQPGGSEFRSPLNCASVPGEGTGGNYFRIGGANGSVCYRLEINTLDLQEILQRAQAFLTPSVLASDSMINGLREMSFYHSSLRYLRLILDLLVPPAAERISAASAAVGNPLDVPIEIIQSSMHRPSWLVDRVIFLCMALHLQVEQLHKDFTALVNARASGSGTTTAYSGGIAVRPELRQYLSSCTTLLAPSIQAHVYEEFMCSCIFQHLTAITGRETTYVETALKAAAAAAGDEELLAPPPPVSEELYAWITLKGPALLEFAAQLGAAVVGARTVYTTRPLAATLLFRMGVSGEGRKVPVPLAKDPQRSGSDLTGLLAVVLRPIARRILRVGPASVDRAKRAARREDGSGSVRGEAEAEAEAEAARLLRELAETMEESYTIDPVHVSGVRWPNAFVRDFESEERLGSLCFTSALRVVVSDCLERMLAGTIAPVPLPKNSREFTHLGSQELLPFLHYLCDIEEVWHSLTAGSNLLESARPILYDCCAALLRERLPASRPFLVMHPLVNTIHWALWLEEDDIPLVRRAGPPAAGGRPPPPTVDPEARPPPPMRVDVRGEHGIRSVLRLSKCITERDAFTDLYAQGARIRLTQRPRPNSDVEKFYERQRHWEELALQALRDCGYDTSNDGDLKLVELLLSGAKHLDNSQIARDDGGAGGAIKLTALALPYASKAKFGLDDGDAATRTEGGEGQLPWPDDLYNAREALGHLYASESQDGAGGRRELRWLPPSQRGSATSFTVAFPKEAGRVVTVHTYLLVQQLFLAIARGGRRGERVTSLSAMAGLGDGDEAEKLLRKMIGCRLLVATGGDTGDGDRRLALNYDFTRQNPREGTVVLLERPKEDVELPDEAEAESFRKQRSELVNTCIVRVLKKDKKELTLLELLDEVKTTLRNRMHIDMRYMKERVEDLILLDYIERKGERRDLFCLKP